MSRTAPHRAPRSRRTAGGLLAAALLGLGLLTGCGGGDADVDATTPEETTAEETTAATETETETSETEPSEPETLEVVAVDFSYEIPEDTFTSGTYEITLTNDGGASHNLMVERDGEDVAGSDTIGPGETTTFEVTLDEGEYVFYCSVGNHRALGMEVPVEVTS